MDKTYPGLTMSNYTFLYQWKRSLYDVDMKRWKADKKEKKRTHQMRVIEKIVNPTLGFEVKHFHIFGTLKKTESEIHNTIPTRKTVAAENDYYLFEDLRKKQPHAVQYNHLYSSMQPKTGTLSVSMPPSSISYTDIKKPLSSDESHGQSSKTPGQSNSK